MQFGGSINSSFTVNGAGFLEVSWLQFRSAAWSFILIIRLSEFFPFLRRNAHLKTCLFVDIRAIYIKKYITLIFIIRAQTVSRITWGGFISVPQMRIKAVALMLRLYTSWYWLDQCKWTHPFPVNVRTDTFGPCFSDAFAWQLKLSMPRFHLLGMAACRKLTSLMVLFFKW